MPHPKSVILTRSDMQAAAVAVTGRKRIPTDRDRYEEVKAYAVSARQAEEVMSLKPGQSLSLTISVEDEPTTFRLQRSKEKNMPSAKTKTPPKGGTTKSKATTQKATPAAPTARQTHAAARPAAEKQAKPAQSKPAAVKAPARTSVATSVRPAKPLAEHKRSREGTPLFEMERVLETEGPWTLVESGFSPAEMPPKRLLDEHGKGQGMGMTKDGQFVGVKTYVGWPTKNWYLLRNAPKDGDAKEFIVGYQVARKYGGVELAPMARTGGKRQDQRSDFDKHFAEGEHGKPAVTETPAAPPIDNDHVAPGAELFSDEVLDANKAQQEVTPPTDAPDGTSREVEEDFSFLKA